MKTGIFVGSFNPPTKAHFAIAHALYNEKIVDQIVFVPVNSLKKELVNLDYRIEMLNIYTEKYNYLEVSNIMKKYITNFNYYVLEELSKLYNNIYLIMGSDLLEKFSFFSHNQEMLKKYHFIIIPRFGIDCKTLIEKDYKDYQKKFIILNYQSSISSSLIRNKLSKKEDISNIVDNCIKKYIDEKKLYHVD